MNQFYKDWRHETLVINKWFGLHAIANLPNRLDKVQQLMQDPAFDIKNPNKVRALIGSFAQFNHVQFHEPTGRAYQFLSQQILNIDPVNPQLAARLMEPFINWRKFDKPRQDLIRHEVEKIRASAHLSKDVYELATKSL